MVIWLYMHINFLIVDILTSFIPMEFLPLCILTWVILNVASTISPFELNPGFFRWGYALPAHEVYQVLVQIWGDGCESQLYRALPILFSWWIAGLVFVVIAMRHRYQTAVAAEDAAVAARHTSQIESSGKEGPSPSRDSSMQEIIPWGRRSTVEASQMEQAAYGPSYPTSFVQE